MSPYSILPFFAFVLNVVLSAWVGAQNRSAPINRAFLSFSLPMAAWALCEFVAWNSVPGPALIALYRVEAVFWIPIGLLILRFAYRLLKRPDDPFLWLCAAVAFAFIVLEFSTDLLVTGATATAYGNRAVYGPAQLPATLFSAGCVVVALYLILCRARSETVPLRRHPLVWVATGIAASLLITVTTEILGPFAFPHRSWIELGPSSTSFISVFTFVAVLRYRFLSLGVEGFAEGLFNALGEGVLITDERLVIRKANPAAERLFLRSPLENLDAGSLLPGLSKAPRHWETRLVPKENAPHRHLIVGISPFSAFGAHHWRFIFLVDNTAAVHARLALAESEKRFRETVDLVPTAIIEVDLEGNVKHANRTAFSMFGYDQEDFDRGLNGYRDIIRPEEHERARRNFADIVERRRTGANEYGLRRKDGTPLHGLLTSAPIWRDGRPVGLRSSISDITEIEGLRGAARRSAARNWSPWAPSPGASPTTSIISSPASSAA
ncbi:MAG: PAS domain S-box protein [Spirochaetes bacterium]|nr:PAS domain S-box protein [Spirochaetota bacterium]